MLAGPLGYRLRSRALRDPDSGIDAPASIRAEADDAQVLRKPRPKLRDVARSPPAYEFLGNQRCAICSNESSGKRRLAIASSGFSAAARNDMVPERVGLSEKGDTHGELGQIFGRAAVKDDLEVVRPILWNTISNNGDVFVIEMTWFRW